MIFVDSSAWFARMVKSDKNHLKAREWMAENEEDFVTTDYIVDETLTLLKAKGAVDQAFEIGKLFFNGSISIIEHIEKADFLTAWQVFQLYSDKGWSFTDCTSKVVMQRLSVDKAFAFDHHFRQFGNLTVVPPVDE